MTAPSYPTPGQPPAGPRSRPVVVTVASYLLYLVAAFQVLRAIVALATYGPISDVVNELYADTAAAPTRPIILGFIIGGAVVALLLGAGLVLLGLLNAKGSNPSRIVTWAVGGVSLCCLGANLGGNALAGSFNYGSSSSTVGGLSEKEVEQRLEAAMPSWATPLTNTLTVLILLALLATIILLALPASNEYFGKRTAAGFDPSTGYAATPGPSQPYPAPPYGQSPYPAPPAAQQPYDQPPHPGQPYPQSQYGQPTYPGQSYPGQSSPLGPQGQPGDPAPGLPPYPGQPNPAPPADQPPGTPDDRA